MGGGAHLRALRRTAVGGFTAAEAAAPVDAVLQPAAAALRDYVSVVVGPEVAAMISHGRPLDRVDGFDGSGPWAVLDQSGTLLAVYEAADDERCRPAVVLT